MAKIRIGNVLFNAFAIITIVAVSFTVFNIIFGATAYSVTSNSMADTLKRGDAVFVRPVDFEDLQVGDVITVNVGDEGCFTHRILEIDCENRTVTTMGDANQSPDPMPSEAAQIKGKMWYSVPLIGYLSILFSGASQIKLLIILALAAAVLIAINTIILKKRRGDDNEKA